MPLLDHKVNHSQRLQSTPMAPHMGLNQKHILIIFLCYIFRKPKFQNSHCIALPSLKWNWLNLDNLRQSPSETSPQVILGWVKLTVQTHSHRWWHERQVIIEHDKGAEGMVWIQCTGTLTYYRNVKPAATLNITIIMLRQSLLWSPGRPGTCYANQVVLELMEIHHLPPKCWD